MIYYQQMFYFSPNFICLYNQGRLRLSWLKQLWREQPLCSMQSLTFCGGIFCPTASQTQTELRVFALGIMLTAELRVAPDSHPWGLDVVWVWWDGCPAEPRTRTQTHAGFQLGQLLPSLPSCCSLEGLRKHRSWAWYKDLPRGTQTTLFKLKSTGGKKGRW